MQIALASPWDTRLSGPNGRQELRSRDPESREPQIGDSEPSDPGFGPPDPGFGPPDPGFGPPDPGFEPGFLCRDPGSGPPDPDSGPPDPDLSLVSYGQTLILTPRELETPFGVSLYIPSRARVGLVPLDSIG